MGLLHRRSFVPQHAQHEGLEALTERYRGPTPSAEAQYQLEQEMIERGTADRDAQFIAVGKVVGRFAPRWVFLWKEYFLLQTVQGTPLLYPALTARGESL
jgi:hypothetical protein